MSESTLRLAFRNYLIENKIPVSLIDFEKSIIQEGENYQVLVLREPNEIAAEIEPIEWPYPAPVVLLVFNSASHEVATIPLSFIAPSAELVDVSPLDFSDYHSLLVSGNHIMLTAVGREPHGGNQCTYIALLTAFGQLVAIWRVDNANGYKTEIQDFSQLQPGYWAVKLEMDEEEQYKPAVTTLNLFSVGQLEAYDLDLDEATIPTVGSLLDAGTDDIKSWFGEEVEAKAHFFVLASSYQCCVYRRPPEKEEGYKKIADLALGDSFIDTLNVATSDREITVMFDNKDELVKSGSFHMSFR